MVRKVPVVMAAVPNSWKSSKNNKTNSKLGFGIWAPLKGGGGKGEEQEEQEVNFKILLNLVTQ